jgi:16S rRNA (guanine(966)-N(2))-methyltransferase RsmD
MRPHSSAAKPQSKPKPRAPSKLNHQVRIIGGQWKRSKLKVLDAAGLRPTPDRVRETLFNWLGQDLSGLRCLDAFAGSGALGLEAASRGAAQVLLVEQDAALVEQAPDVIDHFQFWLTRDRIRVFGEFVPACPSP